MSGTNKKAETNENTHILQWKKNTKEELCNLRMSNIF